MSHIFHYFGIQEDRKSDRLPWLIARANFLSRKYVDVAADETIDGISLQKSLSESGMLGNLSFVT